MALRPELFLEGDTVLTKGAPAMCLYLVDLGKLSVLARPAGDHADEKSQRSLLNAFPAPKAHALDRLFDGGHQQPPPASPPPTSTPERTAHGSHRSSSYIIGRTEERVYVGAEMLAYDGPWKPVVNAATVEAMSHAHLFCLGLRSWQSLCSRFPEELGPIARGESDALKGRAALHPALPVYMRHLSRATSSTHNVLFGGHSGEVKQGAGPPPPPPAGRNPKRRLPLDVRMMKSK